MSTRKVVSAALIATSSGMLAGCNPFTGFACTDEARPGLRVAVVDSLTNANVSGDARVIAREGAYADTAHFRAPLDSPYWLAEEREGTYTVTVEQEGYRLWSRSGIKVTGDRCHVRTVTLTARLQR